MQGPDMQGVLRQGAPIQAQSGFVVQGPPVAMSPGVRPQAMMPGQSMVEVVQPGVPQGMLQSPVQGFLQPYSQGMAQMPAQTWMQSMPASLQQVSTQQSAQPRPAIFEGLPMNIMGWSWPQQGAVPVASPQGFVAMQMGSQAGPWAGSYQGGDPSRITFALR